MLSIIVAVAKNNVIGKDNKLPWSLPDDLKRFRDITRKHAIIMGRKTFESIGRVLPDRKNIVVSTKKVNNSDDDNVEIVKDIADLAPYINSKEECFVIGGQMIYNLLMPYVSKLYITQINHEFEGDAFFPEIDKKIWKLVSNEKGVKDEKNPYDYEYQIYERKI